jgi:hypothetical protein
MVVAGLAGWLAALALSLAIANGDTGAPGFTRALSPWKGPCRRATVGRSSAPTAPRTSPATPRRSSSSVYFGLFCATVLILRVIVAIRATASTGACRTTSS